MAKALVNSLASEWDPDKYNDKYRENLLRIIQGKVKGKEVSLEPTTEAPRADVVDLMERLRRSLEASGTRQRSAGRQRQSAAAEKRPAKGIWAGLYCLPVFDSREDLLAALPPRVQRKAQDLPPFVHVLTHKDLHLHPVLLQGVQPQGEGARWVEAQEWSRLGLPAPMRKLLEAAEA